MKSASIDVYSSLRINRIDKSEYANSCAILKIIDASKFKGKRLELIVNGKSTKNSIGNIFFDALRSSELFEYFENHKPVSFSNDNWENVKISRYVESNDELIFLGFNNQNSYPFLVDEIKLITKSTNTPDSVVYECNFNNSQTVFSSDGFEMFKNLPFNVEIIGKSSNQDSCLSIYFNHDFKLSEQAPESCETIYEQIHPDINIRLPIILLADDHQTYPAADKESLRLLKNELSLLQLPIHRNLGSLIIVWNIIQHFFPYFDEVDVNWDKEFTAAINDLLEEEDFENVLKKLMAKLKDGHINVNPPAYKHVYALPVKWQWIDGRLIIVEVYDEKVGLFPGTIVKKIAGKKTENYFSDVESYIPAATKGALKSGSEFLTLLGTPGDSVSIEVVKVDGRRGKLNLKYSLPPYDNYNRSLNRTRYKVLEDNIYYLNLDQVTMAEIDSLMPNLVKCKGIICDLRGYPNNNHELLNHLLILNDTVDNWFRIPQILYPDQKNISYDGRGWKTIPREPHIDAPVVFITDSRAISYAESVLAFVKHYNLATIVGQPSAGTNGNVNEIILPNGFKTRFTGMKVTNLDGSQHFGVGVLPDVYVDKTIEGVCEGRDEFLEKALEMLNEKK